LFAQIYKNLLHSTTVLKKVLLTGCELDATLPLAKCYFKFKFHSDSAFFSETYGWCPWC